MPENLALADANDVVAFGAIEGTGHLRSPTPCYTSPGVSSLLPAAGLFSAWRVGMFMALIVAALTGGGTAEEAMTPFEHAVSTPRGELKSPYTDFASVAEEGHKIYLSHDCNSCHGGGGGGAMAAPLTNPVWIYGDDDDTLFRVIALGTGSLSPGDAFQKQGFVRKGSEAVVGPMPPFGEIFQTDDDVWKIIAWIRSVNPRPHR